MSDGCKEKGRTACAGCPDLWSCERTREIKLFSREHEGRRFREGYGKSKRKSAARMKVKR